MIRTAVIKLNPTEPQKKFLDDNFSVVFNRASEVLKVWLSMRGEPVYVRKNRLKDKSRNHEIISYDFSNYSSHVSAKQYGKQAYPLIVKSSRARGLRGPMVLPNFRGKSEKSNINKHLNRMFAKGILPIKSLALPKGITAQQDFTAFQVALTAMKSWNDRNNVAANNYQEQMRLIDSIDVDAQIFQHLEDWLAAHKLFLTKKVEAPKEC